MNYRERTVLIFLIAVLLAGAGVNILRRIRQQRQLATIAIVHPSLPSRLENSELGTGDSELSSLPSDSQFPVPDTQRQASILIDLNVASAAELDLLPGIGPALSQRIIDYRQVHKGFRRKDELQKVSGIGPKKYAAIKDRVTAGQR